MNEKWIRPTMCVALMFLVSCEAAILRDHAAPVVRSEPALDYYNAVTTWSDSKIQDEYRQLQENGQSLNPLIRKTKLALLLSVRNGATAKDERQALQLLGGLQEPEPPYAEVARHYLQLGRLLRLVLELRQDARQTNDALHATRQRLEELERRNASLVEQIEALKAIEQQIDQRELSQ